jgi:hypothetical protein
MTRKPFDWPLFFQRLPYHPVPLWLLLNAIAEPFARAFPVLARAACEGRLRQSLMSAELTVYIVLFPALATAAYYLALGRRRIENREHRKIADATFVLMLALSVFDGWKTGSRIHDQWTVLSPGLKAIRAACWP